MLHGQNKKNEEAPLALFCLCTPFGPPSLLEIPHKEVMFKSKHKLDFAFVSLDQRWDYLPGVPGIVAFINNDIEQLIFYPLFFGFVRTT